MAAGIYCAFMQTAEHGITGSSLDPPAPVCVNIGRRPLAALGAVAGISRLVVKCHAAGKKGKAA
jgi:hypothetical protein